MHVNAINLNIFLLKKKKSGCETFLSMGILCGHTCCTPVRTAGAARMAEIETFFTDSKVTKVKRNQIYSHPSMGSPKRALST